MLEPPELLRLEPEAADELLDRLIATVPLRRPFVGVPDAPGTTATVFGDTHGDWRSTLAACTRFLADPGRSFLVGLGDYIDRAPADCGEGSVANALYLLQLAAEYPDRVLLIQGNHETHRKIPVLPHELPEEVDQLWGPVEERYWRLLELLERGPLAATTGSGAYLAHGGFPLAPGDVPFPQELLAPTDDGLAEVVWGEPAASRSHRGFVRPFTEEELDRFRRRSGTSVFVRGHDPDLTGRPIYHGHCLTLHTSRLYERFGGVVVARLPMGERVEDCSGIQIDHLETEGRSYPEPGG